MALVTLLVVSLIAAAVVRSSLAAHRHSRQLQNELQAQWLAESAIERARVQLALDEGYEGETWQPAVGVAASNDGEQAADVARGVTQITVTRPESTPGRIRIEVQARFPDDPLRRVAVSRTFEFQSRP